MTDAATATALQFYNFDGRLAGEVARQVKRVAEREGVSPAELIQQVLSHALAEHVVGGDPTDDVKVDPMTINAGNGGFHVVTVVADGYGYYVAENSAGEERARVKVEESDDPDGPQVFHRLMTEWNKAVNRPES